jgi:hypothetical protein
MIERPPMRKFESRNASFQSSHPPASGIRGAIDSLVQGSLVDLFGAYGVAVAPLPRSSRSQIPTVAYISATVGFVRLALASPAGRITLSLPCALLEQMSPHAAGKLQADWARELANQLMGRIKNRLLPFNVRLQVGVSTLVDSARLAHQLQGSQEARVYIGRTLRGAIIVTFEGMPEDSELSYVGPVSQASEGDAILF